MHVDHSLGRDTRRPVIRGRLKEDLSMRALVKQEAGPGLDLVERPRAHRRPRRRPDPGAAGRAVRHRPAHRAVGRLGRRRRSTAPLVARARVLRRGRRGRRRRSRDVSVGQTGRRARGTSSAAPAATAGPAAGTCASAPVSVGVNRDGAFADYVVHPRRQRVGAAGRPATPTSARCSTRSATPSTPRCQLPARRRGRARSPAPGRSG